jgi:hypothetical protein
MVRFTATQEMRSRPQAAAPPKRRVFLVKRGRLFMVGGGAFVLER